MKLHPRSQGLSESVGRLRALDPIADICKIIIVVGIGGMVTGRGLKLMGKDTAKFVKATCIPNAKKLDTSLRQSSATVVRKAKNEIKDYKSK